MNSPDASKIKMMKERMILQALKIVMKTKIIDVFIGLGSYETRDETIAGHIPSYLQFCIQYDNNPPV